MKVNFNFSTNTKIATLSTLVVMSLFCLPALSFQSNSPSSIEWEGEITKFNIQNGDISLSDTIFTPPSTLFSTVETLREWKLMFDFHIEFNPSSYNFFTLELSDTLQNISLNLLVGKQSDGILIQLNQAEEYLWKTGLLDRSSSRGTFDISSNSSNIALKFKDESGDLDSISIPINQALTLNRVSLRCNYTKTRADKFHFSGFSLNGVLHVDDTPPKLLRAEILSGDTLQIYFSEYVSNIQNVHIRDEGDFHILTSAKPKISEQKNWQIYINELPLGKKYFLTGEVGDLHGNSAPFQTSFILAKAPAFNDLIINEIMPKTSEPFIDAIEIANTSGDYINIDSLKLRYKQNIDQLTYSPKNLILAPEQFLLLTSDSLIIKEILPENTDCIYAEANINMSQSTASLALSWGNSIIDSLTYYDSWHHPFLSEYTNRSLERLTSDTKSISKLWSSSNATDGHSLCQTNTYFIKSETKAHHLSAEPRTLSLMDPTADMIIMYQLPEGDWAGDIQIFSMYGIPIDYLAYNELLGNSGERIWTGLDKNGTLVGDGLYYVTIEAFNTEGRKIRSKIEVAVCSC